MEAPLLFRAALLMKHRQSNTLFSQSTTLFAESNTLFFSLELYFLLTIRTKLYSIYFVENNTLM